MFGFLGSRISGGELWSPLWLAEGRPKIAPTFRFRFQYDQEIVGDDLDTLLHDDVLVTIPSTGAETVVSIFMASMVTSLSPALTSVPKETGGG